MPVKKQYLSGNKVCKVTFTLPQGIEAETAAVVGDFNGWDQQATLLSRLKSGVWKVDVKLEPGKEYQFRYLVNGAEWHSDPEADGSAPNPFGSDNSMIRT